jgi:hypothetical protein
MTRLITLLSTVALMSACASQSKPVALNRIPVDTTVHLDVVKADARLPDASADGGTYAKNVGGGALAGAGMGAVAGFSMGIVCGPAILICGPIGAMGGAMGGAVFGMGAGTIVAATLQLPQEKAEALDVIIERTVEELDMVEKVSTDFRSATVSSWVYVDDEAAVDISVVIEGIRLEKHKKDHLSMSTATTMVVTSHTGDRARVEKRSFRMTSAAHHIDFWIEDNGANFRELLHNQLTDHAARMTAELQGPSRLPGNFGPSAIAVTSASQSVTGVPGE